MIPEKSPRKISKVPPNLKVPRVKKATNISEYKTIGDIIKDEYDQWMETLITTGELFKIDIYDLIRLMDDNNKLLLFERLNQLSLIDLVVDYKLDFTLVNTWINRYIYCQKLWRQSKNRFVSQATTDQQVVLYYYLQKLQLIDLDVIKDRDEQAMVISVLLNRNYDNIRRTMREAVKKAVERKFYSKSNLKRLLTLAENIEYPALISLIKQDLKRLYNL